MFTLADVLGLLCHLCAAYSYKIATVHKRPVLQTGLRATVRWETEEVVKENMELQMLCIADRSGDLGDPQKEDHQEHTYDERMARGETGF